MYNSCNFSLEKCFLNFLKVFLPPGGSGFSMQNQKASHFADPDYWFKGEASCYLEQCRASYWLAGCCPVGSCWSTDAHWSGVTAFYTPQRRRQKDSPSDPTPKIPRRSDACLMLAEEVGGMLFRPPPIYGPYFLGRYVRTCVYSTCVISFLMFSDQKIIDRNTGISLKLWSLTH